MNPNFAETFTETACVFTVRGLYTDTGPWCHQNVRICNQIVLSVQRLCFQPYLHEYWINLHKTNTKCRLYNYICSCWCPSVSTAAATVSPGATFCGKWKFSAISLLNRVKSALNKDQTNKDQTDENTPCMLSIYIRNFLDQNKIKPKYVRNVLKTCFKLKCVLFIKQITKWNN